MIVVGLQNIGDEYKNTRHNAGAIVLDHLVSQKKIDWNNVSGRKREEVEVLIDNERFVFIKPLTFMNISSESMRELPENFDIKKDLVVLHDDIDLPLGSIKISYARNSGGNNGVESLINYFKTNEFLRIRIGVTPTNFFGKMKKPKKTETGDFVLGVFKTRELDKIKEVSNKIEKALVMIKKEGYLKAMSVFNQ